MTEFKCPTCGRESMFDYKTREAELEKEVERLDNGLSIRKQIIEVHKMNTEKGNEKFKQLKKENAELKKGIRGEIKRLKGGLSFVSRCAVLSNLEKILSGGGENET